MEEKERKGRERKAVTIEHCKGTLLVENWSDSLIQRVPSHTSCPSILEDSSSYRNSGMTSYCSRSDACFSLSLMFSPFSLTLFVIDAYAIAFKSLITPIAKDSHVMCSTGRETLSEKVKSRILLSVTSGEALSEG